jgi:uncharacterized protein
MSATNDARISVRLTPRGGRDAVETWDDSILQVRVAAPAVDGRANASLLRLLARALDVAPSRLAIVRGEHSRSKLIAVADLSQQEAERRLGRR